MEDFRSGGRAWTSTRIPDGMNGTMDARTPRPALAATPLVSLGLPVYNGANYLREALDSILAQTYRNWEVVLSDNGSTDGTADICAEYAARDGRIRYYRHAVNMGASRNFNFTFALARGPLFRWTAHDDVAAPDLLERCVAGLLAHPGAVLCHPRTRVIGPAGEAILDYDVRLRTDSPRPEERYHDLVCLDHSCFAIFGLMWSSVLRRTPLLGAFVGSDRNLLAELALHGPFHEIPEFLFYRRDHPNTSTRQFPHASARLAWFRQSPGGARFPTLRRGYEYLASLARAPLDPGERLACLGALGKWCGHRALNLLPMMRAARFARGAQLVGPADGKCYTLPEGAHGIRIDTLRGLRGELQRLDEGLPPLRGGARPSGP